jgi:hypothetical protein
MLKLMLRRDDEFKGSERAIDKPACGRQACLRLPARHGGQAVGRAGKRRAAAIEGDGEAILVPRINSPSRRARLHSHDD